MGKTIAKILKAALFSVILALPQTAAAFRPADPEPADTTMRNATRSLIESFGELSRTASKLSEATLQLLEAQEKALKESDRSEWPAHAETSEQSLNMPADTVSSGPRVFISDESDELGSLWDLQPENAGEGKYIWIPEERREAVEQLLSGRPVSAGKDEPNLDELTYWRGDSIPMALHTKRLGRFDRKLYNWLIYPKGRWQMSMTASYGELSTDDSEFLSLIDDVDINAKSYSVRPAVGYFLRSNMCLGLRFAYSRGEATVNSFNVDIDDDLNFNLHDINFISEKYSAAIFLQQYFGLSRRGRFAVYNEAELAIGSGNKYFTRPFGGEIRQTRSKTRSVALNYSPGVSILIMKNAAFNLSFGVFGFHLTDEKQWENGEESGSRLTSGINFRFNIFNINFGVSIMI